jgi:starch phosphorylase
MTSSASAATKTSNPEELPAPSGIKRRNSRFLLEETKETKKDDKDSVMYRPEFSGVKTTVENEKIWELMSSYMGSDKKSIQRSIVNHVEYTLARTRFNFDNFGAYQAAAYSVRDRLIEAWNDTNQFHTTHDSKRVYYFSLEFLMGRMMQNALVNIDMEDKYKESLMDIGYKLEDLYEQETDAALGNGGLGRLAACFLDSLATLEIPAWGYGIRYDYGIFKQLIVDGKQVEIPDYWLKHGNPWEIERPDVVYPVRFFGHTRKYMDNGIERAEWEGGQLVIA